MTEYKKEDFLKWLEAKNSPCLKNKYILSSLIDDAFNNKYEGGIDPDWLNLESFTWDVSLKLATELKIWKNEVDQEEAKKKKKNNA